MTAQSLDDVSLRNFTHVDEVPEPAFATSASPPA